ncbi:MAG: glycosyltransferase family 1 protein [Planctomycetota bacterium]|jgi:glycosyltransferase involved in cell wall biosynthesis|nr:glycosyltransferase family 1 protein [Planctomycetota bacterium]
MKILLEGHRLARTTDFGGIDSYWHKLVPEMLRQCPGDMRFSLFTAFLNPKNAALVNKFRQQGALAKHWWSSPDWLDKTAKLGARLEWFTGKHDIIHAPEPVFSLPTRGRLVVTAHDLMYLHHPQFLNPRWVARLQEGTSDLAKRANYWICVSEHTRADLVKHYGVPHGRTCVVYHGIDENFRNAGQDSAAVARVRGQYGLAERPYFLFLGSVEPKKNLPMLLRSFGKALQAGLEADLAVAGRAGWQAQEVREVAESLPILRNRLHFLDFVDQADLPPLLGGAKAMVTPSRYEGFGMPLIEAMAAGTVVLSSDRGALPEVGGDAAKFFSPDDVDALAELLRVIDGDDALCENLRSRGLERAADFSWEQCAQQTIVAYRTAATLNR